MTDEKGLDPSVVPANRSEEGMAANKTFSPEETHDIPQDEQIPDAENAAGGEMPADGELAEAAGDGDPAEFDKVVNENDVSEEDAEAAMLSMLEGLPQEEQSVSPDDINFGSASVSNAEFQQLSEPSGGKEPRNIDLLMDVDLPVSIELGRTKMSISDILALGPGSVVELNKLAGEPVDLLVNQKIVAKGEVVVVDENFGLRITQLMTQEERLKTLGKE
ncbi:MAG: flagellar motor switch protein FliN [Candidatus Zixiibacteriota bacterium]